jgi:glycine cleavage system H protein
MVFPDDLLYSEEHEWVRLEGNIATIGVTDFAQDQLGEIVYVELPAEGETFSKSDAFGSVESVKSVNDIYCPLSGKVTEINDPLTDSPETVNEDPYSDGWLIKLEISDEEEVKGLMSALEYKTFTEDEVK